MLKLKLLGPILQNLFPILTAAPSPGQHDPDDEEEEDDVEPSESDNPKHSAAQVETTYLILFIWEGVLKARI